jgi:phosphopantetheinyl transferase
MEQESPGPWANNSRAPGVSKIVLYSPHREPAFLTSAPAPLRRPQKGRQGVSSLGVRPELLAALLGKIPRAERLQDLTLERSTLGKPHLQVGGAPGPAVSFSWSAGRWWVALGTCRSWIGLDAASPGEFAGTYPIKRVFRTSEWQAAAAVTGGEREEAAALLWSVKEAVVKALGCGYHLFGPRQIRIEFAGLGEHGPCWRGHLEAPVSGGVPPGSPGDFPIASVRLHQVWLAVAWMKIATGKACESAG